MDEPSKEVASLDRTTAARPARPTLRTVPGEDPARRGEQDAVERSVLRPAGLAVRTRS